MKFTKETYNYWYELMFLIRSFEIKAEEMYKMQGAIRGFFSRVWGAVKDINYAIFSVCRWIPVWGEHPSREGLAAYLYDKEQISGGYMNLISDDVRWQPKVERYMRGFRTVSCFWESVRKTQRACRGWGWFSWLCFPFVYIFNVFTCVTIDTFREESYWYAAPIYGASDGLVNVKTQRGDGAKWMEGGWRKKIDRPVNHNQMGTWRVKEDFEAVFKGRVDEKGSGSLFLLKERP